jgi:hypothetical protein
MGEKVDRAVSKTLSRAFFRAVLLAGVCGALSACGVSQFTAPFQGGLFGGSKSEASEEKKPITPESLASAAESGQPNGNDLTTASIGCPNVDISSANRTITFNAPGAAADSLSVMQRGEITNTARECNPSSSGLAVKYGFSGRVLLGPKGKAGSITLPAVVTVVDGVKSTVKTEKVRVVVNIPAGADTGYFSEVREISLPMSPGVSPKTYRIYVGFDHTSPGAS